MLLHELRSNPGARKSKKRVGRGNSSGKGTYSGRGMKGQKSRTGKKLKAWFEGGQTPLIQKMPKLKGFRNPNKKVFSPINLEKINSFEGKEKITLEDIYSKGLAKKGSLVKILGNGELKIKISIQAHKISESAKNKIKKAGGSFSEILTDEKEPVKKAEVKISKEKKEESTKKAESKKDTIKKVSKKEESNEK